MLGFQPLQQASSEWAKHAGDVGGSSIPRHSGAPTTAPPHQALGWENWDHSASAEFLRLHVGKHNTQAVCSHHSHQLSALRYRRYYFQATMEAVGVALAIPPLVVHAIKGYKLARAK